MEKVTIHRALSELKVIGARIDKAIDEIIPSGAQQKDKLVNGNMKREDFEEQATQKYQSVIDLIDRRNKIKSAIVQANGVTLVTIGGEQMTIAEAINFKTVITYRKKFVEMLKKRHTNAKAAIEKANSQVDANALKIAETALGKAGVKIGEDDAQKVIGPYIEANKFSMVDPLSIEKKIEDLEKKTSNFEVEVDAVLSEINAVTFIEF